MRRETYSSPPNLPCGFLLRLLGPQSLGLLDVSLTLQQGHELALPLLLLDPLKDLPYAYMYAHKVDGTVHATTFEIRKEGRVEQGHLAGLLDRPYVDPEWRRPPCMGFLGVFFPWVFSL